MTMTPYLTVEEATEFFTTKLECGAWDSSGATQRLRALNEATRRIDALAFVGAKTVSTQANEFPRGGDTVAPKEIKYACALIALSLLDGVDPEMEVENMRISSIGLSSARVTSDTSSVPRYYLAGIPSHEAWGYLQPYLLAGADIELVRES